MAEYAWVFRLDQEFSVRQLSYSCEYLLHPFRLAESNITQITANTKSLSFARALVQTIGSSETFKLLEHTGPSLKWDLDS
jgi:hypothetical protein